MTTASPAPSTGSTNRKIQAILPPIMKAMTKANTSMSGERIARRIIIMNANCTLVTSVVILVTREEVRKWSMFSKEKPWTA